MKLFPVIGLFVFFLLGCSNGSDYEPRDKRPRATPSSSPIYTPHKRHRSDAEQRAINTSVHEQQRAIMRGERADQSIIDSY